MCNFAINICFKQNIMKIKQFLYLLVLVSFIFSSCKKDDDKDYNDDKDYRDKFEGTYETDIVDFLNLIDDKGEKFLLWFLDATEDVIVNKLGANQLMLLFEGGRGYMTVAVDEQGDFSIPSESFKEVDTDDYGVKYTLNLTVSGTGTITNKTLYIKITYSGTILIEAGMDKIDSDVTGAVVYNGKKIN